MSELPDLLDDRLRAGLCELDAAAQRELRPPGAGAVPAAARRRRTRRAAGVAFAAVLAGGVTTGWWLNDGPAADGTDRAAAPGCVPTSGTVFLRIGSTSEVQAAVGSVLGGVPGVAGVRFDPREDAYERFKVYYRDDPNLVQSVQVDSLPDAWRFTLRCAADYPLLRERVAALPGVDEVVCACDASGGPRRFPAVVPEPTR